MRNIFFSQWQLCSARSAYTEEMFCAGAAQTATVILAIVVPTLYSSQKHKSYKLY